jgi:outer membrane protein assembly factor BamB
MDRHGPALLKTVLVFVAALLVTSPAAGQLQPQVKKRPIQIAPAMGIQVRPAAGDEGENGEKKPEDTVGTVFQQPDRKALKALSNARFLLDQNRPTEAIGFLQSILDGPEDFFFQPDDNSQVRLSLKGEAQRLIGQMSREGREIYELRHGADARDLMRKAAANGDARGLAEVSRQFFHTQAGYEATFLLGLDHLDHGRPLAGALTLRRLQQECPGVARFEPALSLAIATCWLRSRMPGEAEHVLMRLKETQSRNILVGGREVALFTKPSDALGWLASLTGPVGTAASGESEQWAMFRGGAARNATVAGSTPLLNMRWRVPTSDHPLVEQLIRQIQGDHEDQGLPALPGLHPLAVHLQPPATFHRGASLPPLVVTDAVLMRTARNLLAVDFKTGIRLWEVPVSDPAETMLAGGNAAVALNQTSQLQAGLAQRVWQDATYGTLSSDGAYVFSIEDLGMGAPRQGGQPMLINVNGRMVQNPAGPRNYNRLAAHDIRTGKLKWHVGGGSEEFDLPLSGAFFLGPPLPLMGQLYALAEIKHEVRLVALDARTGEVIWSQQLAPVDQEANRGGMNVRLLTGVSPSYADGVLVCPISSLATGAVVAVDLATRSLLWGYPYSRELESQGRSRIIALRMGMAVSPGQKFTGQWTDATTIIADGRVLVTPPESEHLHCLNLTDGRVLWKQPREDALFVGGVREGKVLLVAQHDVRAVSLSDGRPAWDGRKVDLPEGAVPSGQGFTSGKEYFLPLSTAEVAAIDLDAGKVSRVARSRGGNVPGNLVCYKEKVISQGADGLEIFFQFDSLRQLADSRLAANPRDAEALAWRGEILLDEGKRVEAVAALRLSLELAAEPRTRDLLRDAMFEGLKSDFAKHRGLTEEIERLIDTPAQRATYLRLMAAGCQAVGDLPAALERYLKLAEVEDEPNRLEEVTKALSVRRDRWIQAQLAALHAAAPAEFQSQINQALEARLTTALQANNVEPLKRFLDYFGNEAVGDRGRRELVARLIKSGQLLEAELLLRQKERSGDPVRSAAAVAETAELLRNAGRAEDATVYYRRLGKELADVVCLDGRTGRQLVQSLPPECDVARLLRGPSPWPVGRVDVKTGTPAPIQQAYHGRFVLSFDNNPAPFFSDKAILFDQNRRMLLANDSLGKELWKPVSLLKPGTNQNMFFAYNRGWNRASVEGHLLILSMGAAIHAFDTLGTGTQEAPKLIWSQDLTDSGAGNGAITIFGGQGINFFQLRQMQMARYQRGATNGLGPVTEKFVCFQRMRHLTAVDPLTGQTLWVRNDVPPGSDLFGDHEYVFAVPPRQSYAMVLRALDGQLLGKRALPKPAEPPAVPAGAPVAAPVDDDGEEVPGVSPFQQFCIATCGRNLVFWRPVGDRHVLQVFDVWQQKDLWPPRNFDPNAKFAFVGREAIGVLEPNGHFVAIALPDGRTIIDTAVQPEPTLTGIYFIRLQDEYFLVAHSPQRPGEAVQPSQPLPGTLFGPVASGRVYGFSLEGKPLWPKPVEVGQQQLLLSQPGRLPVLTFAGQIYERRANGSGSYHVAVLCIDKRTGRKVCDEKFPNSTGVFDLYGDPEKKTVEAVTQRNSVTMTFTDQPLPPEPVVKKAAPTIGGALMKALGKAISEEPEEGQAAPAVPADPPAPPVPEKPAEKPAGAQRK